ncbi:Cerato-platanin-domain-containing protein [Paxillus ammoniavirescens]|nr:Cerato-platanin-domain-containing protein [Paxillus ammoniavirescens]
MYFQVSTLFSLALALASALHVLAQTTQTTLSYDANYDNANLSLSRVACSDGPNGLESKNYTTLGSLPDFPFVGGVFTVDGWNSPQCGTCYAVTYGDVTINVLAVDVSKAGFTISQEGMDALTHNQAVALGRVNVTYELVDPQACGLPSA